MRLRGLDAMRGAAVLLMVADHSFALWQLHGGPGWLDILRHTVTRPSLILFMVVSGYLLASRGYASGLRRLLPVALAGVVVTVAFWLMGFPVPDVLVVYVLTVPLWHLLGRWPVPVVALGFLQAFSWPIPWGGYQPGYVLGWLGLGVVAFQLGLRFDSGQRFLEPVGRRPLSLYVWHVLVLLFVAAVVA